MNDLPRIPASEYPERWRRVQAMMAEQDLDILVAYADDRAVFGPAHARWLANFPVHFEPLCILFARSGDPIMLVGPERDEYARLVGEISDVRILQEFTHPDEDYPFSTIQSLGEIIADLGHGAGDVRRIGIGARGLMSGRPVLIGNVGAEIECALDVAVEAQQACFEAFRPGIEGREVEAIGRSIVERAGLGEYFLYSGVHSLGVIEFEPPIFGPSSAAIIKQGMVISVDIPLFNAPWGGMRIEDGYLITDVAAEKLLDTPFVLRL